MRKGSARAKMIKKEKSRYQNHNRSYCCAKAGSLTVEAAIALPFFIMALMAVCSFFSLQVLHIRLQAAMEYAAGRASAYYYALEHAQEALSIGTEDSDDVAFILSRGAVTAAYLKGKVTAEVGEDYLNRSWLENGSSSLGILGSSFPDSSGNIDFVLTYRVRIPFLPGSLGKISITQRTCRRVWSGISGKDRDEQDIEDTMVYVTETGSVYHLSLSCSYLKLSIKYVSKKEAEGLRSSDGSKYYACERCDPTEDTQFVYLTEDGDRYHSDINCSSLKRGIRTVALSSLQGWRACSRCGGRE